MGPHPITEGDQSPENQAERELGGPWPAKEKRPLRQRSGLKAGDEEELLATPPKRDEATGLWSQEKRQQNGGWLVKKKKKHLSETTGVVRVQPSP